jgi:hypothetical protein
MTVIGMNENGYRIGMSHQNCTISQEIVDKMRDMHEDEMVGYRREKIVKISTSSTHGRGNYRLILGWIK